MKIRFILTSFLFIVCFFTCQGQYDDRKIILTVDGRGSEAGEFVRMYKKSIAPDRKGSLKEYLNQFIAFKLKVASAIDMGYDTTRAFRDELSGYRNQLAQSYLTDPGIREKLLRKAKDRYPFEISASHILVNCSSEASPRDTLAAYSKALDIRQKILEGEDFDKLAKEVSDDRTAVNNGGRIGYFTIFQMPWSFEDAAYSLTPGSVSMPVRTAHGYHLILVHDRRDLQGSIRTAHIMKAVPAGANETELEKAEREINDLYSRLREGESFSRLAKEFSDHKESARNGGEMNWFGTGEIIPEFAEPAFALKDTGDYTKPLRTAFGFHIIKLLEKKPPLPWEEVKPLLEARINQYDLDALGKKSFIARLKREYNYLIDQDVYDWFVKNTDSLIISGKARFDESKIPGGSIFTFAGRFFTAKSFAVLLEETPLPHLAKNTVYFVNSALETATNDEILKYEDSILESKYPDFKYLMAEFHDGILLFDISLEKIWNKMQDDSTGLMNYYLANRGRYLSPASIRGKLYTLMDQSGKNLLFSAFRKNANKAEGDSLLLVRFNTEGDTLLSITSATWSAGDDPEIDRLKWRVGVHRLVKNGYPSILKIEEINEPSPLPFTEAQAEVITDYQDWLTDKWVEKLKQEHMVIIDRAVYAEVEKELANE